VRRNMNFPSIGEKKAVSFPVFVDEELIHGSGDFGQMVGVNPVHGVSLRVTVRSVPSLHRKGRASLRRPDFKGFFASGCRAVVVFHDGVPSQNRTDARAGRPLAGMGGRRGLSPAMARGSGASLLVVRSLSLPKAVFFGLGVQELTVNPEPPCGFGTVAFRFYKGVRYHAAFELFERG
jgi:hypothetical protein